MGFEPDPQNRVMVDEARLEVLGGLSASIALSTSSAVARKTEILLVINMFGLSSSWYDLDDLGLEHYMAAATLLNGQSVTPNSQGFFGEFLVCKFPSFQVLLSSFDSMSPETLCFHLG